MLDILKFTNKTQLKQLITNLFYNNSMKFKQALKLDEQGKLGYTLKTMSAALWAFNHATDFQSGLKSVIEQGGDADTNGAVAGALLGLKFGFDRIPKDLVDNLVGKEDLIKKTESFIESLAL